MTHDPYCPDALPRRDYCCDWVVEIRADERARIADRMRPILASHRISPWALDSIMAELRKAVDKVPPPLPPSVGVPEKSWGLHDAEVTGREQSLSKGLWIGYAIGTFMLLIPIIVFVVTQ